MELTLNNETKTYEASENSLCELKDVWRNVEFMHEDFGKIRVLVKDDEPWFVAKDIADVLGFEEGNRITRWLSPKKQTTALKLVGRNKIKGLRKDTRLIKESGLYSLIFRSHKPEARRFEDWVVSDVLPSIRKHGGYLTPQKAEDILNDPDALIQFAKQLTEKCQKYLEAEDPSSIVLDL